MTVSHPDTNEIESIHRLTIALNSARHARHLEGVVAICGQLAAIHRDRGEWAVAKSFQQQAIAARLRPNGPAVDGFRPADFVALANDSISQGDLESAEELVKHALMGREMSNCPAELADAWGTRGTIALLNHQPTAAWRCYRKAYFLHSFAGDDLGRLMDLLNLAAAGRALGWWDMVHRLLLKARGEARRTRNFRLLQKVDHFLEEAHRVKSVSSRTPEWN